MSGCTPLIDNSEQITESWLTAVLVQADLLQDDQVLDDFTVESLSGAGRGFLSSVVRVHLDYAGERGAAPSSLIVKFPAANDVRFELGASFNAYEREMRFYRDVASSTSIRAPRCFHAAAGEVSGSALIVLEDARDWTPADQVLGITPSQVETAIDMIAGLHARWWESPDLETLDWVPKTVWDHASLFEASWPGFLDHHRHWLSSESLRLGDRFAASGQAMKLAVERPPRTLIHGDYRADNMMVDGPEADDPLMVLDWQMLARTMGAFDPARVVCGSLESALPERGYFAYAERWHRRLVGLGVENYSLDEAWRDFRVGLLNALYIPVCFHSNISHEGARAIRLLEALTHRMFRAAEECNAMASLEGV